MQRHVCTRTVCPKRLVGWNDIAPSNLRKLVSTPAQQRIIKNKKTWRTEINITMRNKDARCMLHYPGRYKALSDLQRKQVLIQIALARPRCKNWMR